MRLRLLTITLICVAACKARQNSELLSQTPNATDAAFVENPELAGYGIQDVTTPLSDEGAVIEGEPDVGLIAANRSDGQTPGGLNPNGQEEQFALADVGTPTAEQEADFALQGSQTMQGLLGSLDQSPAAYLTLQILLSMGDLFVGDNQQAYIDNAKQFFTASTQQANPGLSLADDSLFNQAQKFLKKNVEVVALNDMVLGNNVDEKAAVIEKLKTLGDKAKTLTSNPQAQRSPAQQAALDAFLRRIAGRDGLINFGDGTRILPVIPALVNEIGQAKKAAELRQFQRQYPVLAGRNAEYERRLRAAGGDESRVRGFFPIVRSQVRPKINAGNARIQDSINKAGSVSQQVFYESLLKMGVSSYYFGDDAQQDYSDNEPAITTVELRDIAKTMGVPLGGNQFPSYQTVNAQVAPLLAQITKEVAFPDGIPVGEALALKQESTTNKFALPKNLIFRLDPAGRLVVAAKRYAPCTCSYSVEDNTCKLRFRPRHPGYDPKESYNYSLAVANESQCNAAQCDALFTKTGNKLSMPKACANAYLVNGEYRFFNRIGNTYVAEVGNSSAAGIANNTSNTPATQTSNVTKPNNQSNQAATVTPSTAGKTRCICRTYTYPNEFRCILEPSMAYYRGRTCTPSLCDGFKSNDPAKDLAKGCSEVIYTRSVYDQK